MKKCPYCGKEYPDEATVCAVDQSPLVDKVSGPALAANAPFAPKPVAACPACGAREGYKPALELRGSFSLIAFLAGGLFAVLFLNAGRRRKVQCNQCGAFYNIRTPLSRVSLAVFWLLVAPTVVVLVILLFLVLRLFFTGEG